MEVICINDTYPPKVLEIYQKYNIRYPKVNELCEVLQVVTYPRLGKKGFILKNYENQYITGMAYGVETSTQASFNVNRFTTLLGRTITEEILEEIVKHEQNTLTKDGDYEI